MVYHRLESSSSGDGPAAREDSRKVRDDEGSRHYSESGRSRSARDDDRYSRSVRRDEVRYSRGREKDKYYDRYSDRPRYRDSPRYQENYRYEDGPRYSDRSRYAEDSRYLDDSRYVDDRRYEYGQRYSSDDSRYAENSRYSGDSSRYRRGEDWYSGSRYRHEEAETSKPWKEEDEVEEEQKEPSPPPVPEKEPLKNAFQNDGSFLEMFKKMQEQTNPPTEEPDPTPVETEVPLVTETVPKKTPPVIVPPTSIVGKRRGGRVLPTGMVKKQKKGEETPETPKDAWSLYMAEVRKYKEACCEEEGKTRPLVK